MKALKITGIATLAIFLIWLVGSLYVFSQTPASLFNNRVSWAPVPQYNYQLSFIKNAEDQNISLWYFPKAGTSKVILYLHGNSGRLPNIISSLNSQASVLSVAYPGYHESEGSPSVEGTYDAAVRAYDWLVNDKKTEEKNITIFGHSMGGSPAVYLASKKSNAKQLVIVNTFSSVQSMCFRSYSILCAFNGGLFNSANNAGNVSIPVRQFAYKNDDTVPFEEGKTLYTYFKSDDKKFIEMDKITHSYPDFEIIFKEVQL